MRWAFPCRDFQVDRTVDIVGVKHSGEIAAETLHLHGGMAGAWAACPACHALIVRGARDKLVRRCAKRQLRGTDFMSLSQCMTLIRPLHDQFWSNREGAPVPTTPDDREDPTR